MQYPQPTPFEMNLVLDAGIMHAKNSIVAKVRAMFGNLANQLVEGPGTMLPGELREPLPKISRGEQYLGLPWVMLDYPRHFSKTDVCAIRIMFWWGHCFSIHLHLSGRFAKQYYAAIEQAGQQGAWRQWFVATGTHEWEHHFESTNYLPYQPGVIGQQTSGFLKLAKKIPLSEWNKAPGLLTEEYCLLCKLLAG